MDLIDRQAAIEVVKHAWAKGLEPTQYLEELPAVQPLVIHCTDCEDWLERQSILGVTISELPSVQPQPEEDCDTCKHGYFGDRQCDNCLVRYPSHYEREEEQHGSD